MANCVLFRGKKGFDISTLPYGLNSLPNRNTSTVSKWSAPKRPSATVSYKHLMAILMERRSELSNPNTPFAQRLTNVINTLTDMAVDGGLTDEERSKNNGR